MAVRHFIFPGSKKGHKLAAAIQSKLGQVMAPDRGIKEGWYKLNPKNGPNIFLADTNCPAVIIEPEFINNIDIILKYRESACEAIVAGIKSYLGAVNE